MPFGLGTACYFFTKLMRLLVKLWRSEGVRSFVYIDDGMMASNNLQEAGIISNTIKSDLQNAGFLINHKLDSYQTNIVVGVRIRFQFYDIESKRLESREVS